MYDDMETLMHTEEAEFSLSSPMTLKTISTFISYNTCFIDINNVAMSYTIRSTTYFVTDAHTVLNTKCICYQRATVVVAHAFIFM